MADAYSFMREWAARYIKHRDIAAGRIAKIIDSEDGLLVSNKDGTSLKCVIRLSLAGLGASSLANAALLVTLSNDANIKAVASMWDSLSKNTGLLIVFASPFSSGEEKWLLKPHLHERVCDRASLLQGLKGMAELVEPVDEAGLKDKIK